MVNSLIQILDKSIRSTTLPKTRIPMRIHDPNRSVVKWSEIQHIQCPRGIAITEWTTPDSDAAPSRRLKNKITDEKLDTQNYIKRLNSNGTAFRFFLWDSFFVLPCKYSSRDSRSVVDLNGGDGCTAAEKLKFFIVL